MSEQFWRNEISSYFRLLGTLGDLVKSNLQTRLEFGGRDGKYVKLYIYSNY